MSAAAQQTQSLGAAGEQPAVVPFCHAFDLTKRLVHPPLAKMDFLQLNVNIKPAQSQSQSQSQSPSPFSPVLERLQHSLAASPPHTVHRVVIPSMLSPALYPPQCSQPQYVLQFLHGLRSLFATYPNQLTAIMSLPLSLYPRSAGLTRWIELLNDGVFELSPFPHSSDGGENSNAGARGGPPGTTEEPPQGLLRVHRLPVFHDRGSGVGTSDEDWTFTLSRRKFTIKPFNLPPLDGDTEAQQQQPQKASGSEQKPKKSDLEF